MDELREKIKDEVSKLVNPDTGEYVVPEKALSWRNSGIIADYIVGELKRVEREARNNSLLDLERWIKLHDLDKEMILDGIEHMVKSNLQVPDQPRLDNSDRLATLKSESENK